VNKQAVKHNIHKD